LRHKPPNNDYKNKQSSSKRKSLLFEPIILTSFGSSNNSHYEENSYVNSPSSTLDTFQFDPFSDDESFNHMNFASIDRDHLISQVSDA